MKLRCELEVDVPDEVGEVVLTEQETTKDYRFTHFVYLENWTYRMEAPVVWKRVAASD